MIELVAEAPATSSATSSQAILSHMQPGRDYSRAEITALSICADRNWAIRQLREHGKVIQRGE